MEANCLRQFLKNLCYDLQWDYTVFWKLNHCNTMLLTWEDGYCKYQKPKEVVEGTLDNVHLSKTTRVAFDFEIGATNGTSPGYPVEMAMASMSRLLYSFGEGCIGKVASTGNHCWIFTDELDSKLLTEYPDEFLLQFAAGIKTILLVPVVPHGVLQLGSLQKVNEDHALLFHIREAFNTFHHNLGESMRSTINRDLPGPSSSLISSLLENLISGSSHNTPDSILSEIEGKYPRALDNIHLTELSKCTPDKKFHTVAQDDRQVHGYKIDNIRNTEFHDLPMGSTTISLLQDQFPSGNFLKPVELDEINFSCQVDDLPFSSTCHSSELRFETNVGMNAYLDGMMDQQLVEETGEVTDQITSHEFLNFPTDSELHKALGQALGEGNEFIWNPYILSQDVCSSSSMIYHTDFIGSVEQSIGESHGFLVKTGDADNLLDAMVSSMYDASGNISSTKSNCVRSPTISSGQVAASCQTQIQSRCSIVEENDSDPRDFKRTDLVSRRGNVLPRSPTRSSLESTRSDLIDVEQQKGFGYTQSRKRTKLSDTSHKKARECDVQRPRPRDRQLIQDRVKELRELVPNGAKCSIDSLLDQTIRHMLFLRSVTNRAEKLKHCVHPEANDGVKMKSAENQGPGNGTSWAFDLGSQFGVCPIVVKDLEQPGHMLIEMLCEEDGLFLEIAQVIRRLELTILKGVTETRLEKSWAHFIVEASTGFRRMDIFWPLMKLLQRNSSISGMI